MTLDEAARGRQHRETAEVHERTFAKLKSSSLRNLQKDRKVGSAGATEFGLCAAVVAFFFREEVAASASLVKLAIAATQAMATTAVLPTLVIHELDSPV